MSQLHSFEVEALLSPESVEGKYYRHLLQIQFTSDQPPQLCTKIAYRGSPKDWAFLASVVCAYRLADVVALLESQDIVEPVAVFRSLKEGPITPLPVSPPLFFEVYSDAPLEVLRTVGRLDKAVAVVQGCFLARPENNVWASAG